MITIATTKAGMVDAFRPGVAKKIIEVARSTAEPRPGISRFPREALVRNTSLFRGFCRCSRTATPRAHARGRVLWPANYLVDLLVTRPTSRP